MNFNCLLTICGMATMFAVANAECSDFMLATQDNIDMCGSGEFRYKYEISESHYYLSPLTTAQWSWDSGVYTEVPGDYEYTTDGGVTFDSFSCEGSTEKPSYGVGCSTGGGVRPKAIPWSAGSQNAAAGTGKLCMVDNTWSGECYLNAAAYLSACSGSCAPSDTGCADKATAREVVAEKIYGCPGTIASGGTLGTAAAALCDAGYHVCESAKEASYLGLTTDLCRSVARNDQEFFATQETSKGDGQCESVYGNPQSLKNDIWGCVASSAPSGTALNNAAPCLSLPGFIGNDHFYAWDLSAGNTANEAQTYKLTNAANGGVLCCVDGAESNLLCDSQLAWTDETGAWQRDYSACSVQEVDSQTSIFGRTRFDISSISASLISDSSRYPIRYSVTGQISGSTYYSTSSFGIIMVKGSIYNYYPGVEFYSNPCQFSRAYITSNGITTYTYPTSFADGSAIDLSCSAEIKLTVELTAPDAQTYNYYINDQLVGAISFGQYYTSTTTKFGIFANAGTTTVSRAELSEYEHLGCYADSSNRALDTQYSNVNSIGDCGSQCAAFNYFSLQYGAECFCDDSLDDATQYGASTACWGQGLGGTWSHDLYRNPHFATQSDQPSAPSVDVYPRAIVLDWNSTSVGFIAGVLALLLVVNLVMMAYANCRARKNGRTRYQTVKMVDSDVEPSEAEAINI